MDFSQISRHTRALTGNFDLKRLVEFETIYFRCINLLTFRVRGKLVVAVAGSRLLAIMPKESIGDCSTVECAAAAAAATSADVAVQLYWWQGDVCVRGAG